ncbi:MAG: RNA polymerase sigma factor [Bacteroidales bacterium]|nr:RNA polymerase sigma factor [Bacteroidales bacterium]
MDEKLKHIIIGCQKNKRQAQKALYDSYSERLFGVCLRYSSNTEEAEDVLHDSFIKILNKIEQYQFKGSFEGWMRRITVNTALERYRGQYKVINIQDSVKEFHEESYEDVLEQLTAGELINLVQELSPKYKVVFNLYAIEGYSHQEIAKKLDISEGTSKSNLSRARGILQEKIKKYYNFNIKLGNN